MFIPSRLTSYPYENRIDDRIPYHQMVYPAQEVTAAQHVSGRELANAIAARVDSELVILVLPTSSIGDMDKVKRLFPPKSEGLAREEEFQDLFPGCEIGGMPSFGSLNDLWVYVDTALASDLASFSSPDSTSKPSGWRIGISSI